MTDTPEAVPALSEPLAAAAADGWLVHPTPGWWYKGTSVVSETDLVARYSISGQIAGGRKHPLVAPIDVSKVKKEGDVKDIVKRLLDFHGWFWWMPAANGYGKIGIHDFNAFKDGVFMTIEAKHGSNKPTVHQRQFGGQIIANEGFAFCVNEGNIDHLAMFLESFHHSQVEASHGREPTQEHGSRMLNAISILTDLWKGPEA